MDILDHSSKPRCLLEKIFTCAPDIAVLYSLEICKKLALGKKFIYSIQLSVNCAVVDDIICIFRFRVKFFHLHIHSGKGIIILSCVFRDIIATCKRNHLRNIISALSHIYCAYRVDIKERYGLVCLICCENFIQLVCLLLENFFCEIFFSKENCIKLHPFCSSKRMALVAGTLYHNRDSKLLQFFLNFRIMVDHGGLDCQITAFI